MGRKCLDDRTDLHDLFLASFGLINNALSGTVPTEFGLLTDLSEFVRMQLQSNDRLSP